MSAHDRVEPERAAPEIVGAVVFSAWVATAAASESFTYYRGHLGHDRMRAAEIYPFETRRRLAALADRALALADDGFVRLVQKRLGFGAWAYVAVRSRKRLPAACSQALLERVGEKPDADTAMPAPEPNSDRRAGGDGGVLQTNGGAARPARAGRRSFGARSCPAAPHRMV